MRLPSARVSEAEATSVTRSPAGWPVEHRRPAAEGIRMVFISRQDPGAAGPACDIAIRLRAGR